jgi:hypothetical protein
MTENIKVTRKPTYSVQKLKDGSSLVRYSTQINGREIVSEYRAKSTGEALSGAKSRYERTLRSRHEELSGQDLDNVIGTPTQESPENFKFRQSQDPELTEASNLALDTDSLDPEELLSIERAASSQDEDKGIMTKGMPKNHVPYVVSMEGQGMELTGDAGTVLEEPNPKYLFRPGDESIIGKNNTIIVMGRDHSPQNSQIYSKEIAKRNYNSGYSDHMGAGAIDIVAGRLAPFPLETLPAGKDIVAAPSFNTSYPVELQNVNLTNGKHPGMVMDAARIYISQMTNIDENFKISTLIRPGDSVSKSVAPTSGIMLKADKVRMHARQDIKIITGGPYETINSQGNEIRKNNGIHLIAQNGIDERGRPIPQQPIPLGDNLMIALESIMKNISDLTGSLDAYVEFQMRFNRVVGNSFELLPIPGGITAGNPLTKLQSIITTIEQIVKTRLGAFYQELNNFNFRTNYLEPTSKNYINSQYNTVN